MSALLIGSYLLVIIMANLSVTLIGPNALYYTAFLLIPFDLTSRDLLHEKWSKNNLFIKMFLLIFSGSMISFIINRNAEKIAIASCISFFISGFFDFIIYESLKGLSNKFKMNASNIVSSIVDSFVFPYIAFNMISPSFSMGQSTLKIFGGFFWTIILIYFSKIKFRKFF